MIAACVPVLVLVLLAFTWLVLLARFLTCLAAREPRTWAALGKPVLRFCGWEFPPLAVQTPADDDRRDAPAATRRPRVPGAPDNLWSFIVQGRHLQLRDLQCSRLGARLRAVLLAYPLALAGMLLYLARSSLPA